MSGNQDSLHYEAIESRARAARIAVLVDSNDKDWRDTILRVIEFLSAVWGGRHSVIVPTDGSTIDPVFWEILEKFSPDHVVSYTKTGGDLAISDPLAFGEAVERRARAWIDAGGTDSEATRTDIEENLRGAMVDRFHLSVELKSQLASRLVPFHYEQHFQTISCSGVHWPFTRLADVLPLAENVAQYATFEVPSRLDPVWWSALAGRFNLDTVNELSEAGITQSNTTVNPEQANEFVRWLLARDQNPGRKRINKILMGGPDFVAPAVDTPTPFAASMTGLVEYGTWEASQAAEDQGALVIGDSLADFCLAYSLPKIGQRAFWLPLAWLNILDEKGNPSINPYARAVLGAIPSKVKFRQGVNITSYSLDADALTGAVDKLRRFAGLGLNGAAPLVVSSRQFVTDAEDPMVPYCIDSSRGYAVYPFAESVSVGPIDTPLPTGFSSIRATKHRWVTEYRFADRVVPVVPHVAETLLQQTVSNGTSVEIRVSRGALACDPLSRVIMGDNVNSNLRPPRVTKFNTLTALGILAAKKGFSCQLSDKGVYLQSLLQKAGGLKAAAKLLVDKDSNRLLFRFKDHARPTQGVYDEGCVLHADKRRYLDLGAVCKAIDADQDLAVRLTDRLVQSKMLYRGFVFSCSTCKHADWYALGSVSDEFRCRRCNAQEIISQKSWKHPAAPQIYFKLDEIIFQFLANDGDVTLLGLNYMAKNSKDPFDFTAEVDFQREGIKCEVDICGVWDGELVIGEAKRVGSLGKGQKEIAKAAQKYVRLASDLYARRVVFFTSDAQWEERTVVAVKSEFEGSLATPMFFARAELFGVDVK